MSMRLAGFTPPARNNKVAGAVDLVKQIANTRQSINAAVASGNTAQEARLRNLLEKLEDQQKSAIRSSFVQGA